MAGRACQRQSNAAITIGMTATTLPTAAANCERLIRAISGDELVEHPVALSRIVPASAAAVIDGCLVASVKPRNCMMRKLAA